MINKLNYSFLEEIIDKIINLGKAGRTIKKSDYSFNVPVSIIPNAKRYGNINVREAAVLSSLAKSVNPNFIFEIGTYDGYSAWHLAENTKATIYTLDLPPKESKDYYKKSSLLVEGKGIPEKDIIYSHSRICKLYGNSKTFDFSSYKVDFVFIDGSHEYSFVKSDTENALKILNNGGMIAWHDFNVQHRGVYKYLMEFGKTHEVFYVENTRLAYFVK